ncbi:Peptidyl-prolyl cis-trans isomerase [Streptococcus sp. HSISS3]|nr:Peptidyl-prolyl cis-trans isomerase [Streptococcus sp. HSISS3]
MPVNAKIKYKAKKTKIVFFDIDDTLRVKKTGYIPESIKAVFKGLKEKGILTGIATGRGYYGVVEEIRDLEPDYFVTINGTYVINRKTMKFTIIPFHVRLQKPSLHGAKRLGLPGGLQVRISQLFQSVQT